MNRVSDRYQQGLNFMQGLKLQLGLTGSFTSMHMQNWNHYAKTVEVVTGDSSLASIPEWTSSYVTRSIKIPEVTYDLNIFNSTGQTTHILARPIITAVSGKHAKFFSGKNIILGLTGIDSSSIEKFPVGLSLDILPVILPNGDINFDVKIE